MDIYTFRETPTNFYTPSKRRRSTCLMRDEIASSTSACDEFKREMSFMRIKYPFLTESQIQGRTMDKFGIPNIMGKPYKLKSGSVTYSTVNHILYLIKRSVTEKKSSKKNSFVKRRHTISGAYIPIEIITSKFDIRKNLKPRKNLEKKFSLYSADNDISDDDYNIESSSEYSLGRLSDKLSISEFGCSYQSDEDEVLETFKIKKTYERKSLDKSPANSCLKDKKKRVPEIDDANFKKLTLNETITIPKETVLEITSLDKDAKENGNDEEMNEERGNDGSKDSGNQNEEVYHTSDANSDLTNSSENEMLGKSINTRDTLERGSNDCNHEVAAKKPAVSSRNPLIHSQARKRTNSVVGNPHFKEALYKLHRKLDEEIDELQIIFEKLEGKRAVEVKVEENFNKVKQSQENNIASGSSSLLENRPKATDVSGAKSQYIKQSISICSSEYVWQDGSGSSIESSSINSETQTFHKYFQRSRLQKISVPFTSMDPSYNATSSQGNTLEDYKRRRGYCRKTSECIIVVDLEAQTDSERNADEFSTSSGENFEENKTFMIHPHDPASENSNYSASDRNDTASPVSDNSSNQDDDIDLNVAFSPHFANQNASGYSSDGNITSQETEVAEVILERSERSTTYEIENEGYYLANLFDDDDCPTNRQRTLRSTSLAENLSEDDEPTIVD